MRFGPICRCRASMIGLALTFVVTLPARGDDPGRFSRFFRLGSASEASKSSSAPAPAAGANSTPSAATPYRSVGDSYGPPALSTPATTAVGSGAGNLTPTPRITPKARSTKAITEADPLVTQVGMGRAEGGESFVMFLQVYADGTVIDSSGVHKIGPDALKPVVDAVSSSDFARLKGHCGGPAGDTFETIQMVTYERAYGRLRANSFSYSGNPQGCDHAVHHLHKVLDELQMKLITPGLAGPTTATTTPVVVSPPMGPLISQPVPMVTPATTSGTLAMPSLPDPGLH